MYVEKCTWNTVAYQIVDLIGNIFSGKMNASRAGRWVAFQAKIGKAQNGSTLGAILVEVRKANEAASSDEEEMYRLKGFLERVESTFHKVTATDLDELESKLEHIVAGKRDSPQPPAAKRCPTPGDTRASSGADIYSHVTPRLRTLVGFLASELSGTDKPCESLKSLCRIFGSRPLEELQEALRQEEVVQAAIRLDCCSTPTVRGVSSGSPTPSCPLNLGSPVFPPLDTLCSVVYQNCFVKSDT